MVVDLLSLMAAYGAGTCWDKISTIYSAVLVAIFFHYILVLKLMGYWDKNSDSGAPSAGSRDSGATPTPNPDSGSGTIPAPVNCCDDGMPVSNINTGSTGVMPTPNADSGAHTIPAPILSSDPVVEERLRSRKALKKLKAEERLRKVLMLLATFAVSITYVAGLSTPGGFWDSIGGSHHPGDAILKDKHSPRLMVFILCNTTAFVASLLITMVLIIDGKKLGKKKMVRSRILCGCIVIALVGLVAAYVAGSCREIDNTAYVVSLVGAVLAMAHIIPIYASASKSLSSCFFRYQRFSIRTLKKLSRLMIIQQTGDNAITIEALDKARSLVLLLATLTATITYTAGLDPPGGLWQDNTDGHMAGDPILLTINPRRYKAFFYCNSVAFVASLVAIVLVQKEILVKHHVLEAAMILNLFGLIGAYAAGSCRDVNTSINDMALAGAVLAYVVIHIVFFTLNYKEKEDDDKASQLLEKRRKRLLLFAILAATITYQAGLTPPGGFLLQDEKLGYHAGDPVLLYNFPRRYKVFFYCNSASFMLSIALLVNPNLYRPAIRSNALSVCTAVGLFGLMGAYTAGSTQHIKTSIYIFVFVAMVLFVAAIMLLVFLMRELKRNVNSAAAVSSISIEQKHEEEQERKEDEEERKKHARRKYLMLLGILVATWQSSGNGYEAGDPVMHDNRRPRYLVFFHNNSFSFMASIVKWSLRVLNWTILVDLFALLVAYAAGSTRVWKTSMYVVMLIVAVLSYFAIHMTLSMWSDRRRRQRHEGHQSSQTHPPV
ncbi:hypothetical protein VPH35_106687 [Triticum aestivum]